MNFQEQWAKIEEPRDEVRRLNRHAICSLLALPIAGGVGSFGLFENNLPLAIGGYSAGIGLGIYISHLFSKVSQIYLDPSEHNSKQ